MKLQIQLHPVTLQLTDIFNISRDSYSERRSLIVELCTGTARGYGEASEHGYYGIHLADLTERAEQVRPWLEGYSFETPEQLWKDLHPLLQDLPFLQCAIDNAAHDLFGKLKGQPSHRIWNLSAQDLIKTCYTIGIDPIEKMVSKIKKQDFDIYKIKLGTDHDLEIIRALRTHTDALFRVDANCGWTADQTIAYAPTLKDLGVEFIEQPLPADDWEGMKKVRQQSALPVLADESCILEADVERCAEYFDGIVIKLMKCGGITPARRMIERAQMLNLRVMCGCMVESSVGISAIAQLLPLLDYVDMDGALLIDNDPATGVRIASDGTIRLPERNGLGIQLHTEVI